MPLTLPSDSGFTQSRFEIRRMTGMSTSPFTGVQQVYEHPYALWGATLTLPPLSASDAQAWKALFMQLRGRSGTFLLGDPDHREPTGAITGNVTLDGAINVGDTTISVDTVNYSVEGVFKSGDYIQIGTGADSKLYMVIGDCDTDANGKTDITVEPAIKQAAVDSATVIYNNPVGVFRMESDTTGWDSNHMKVHGITFSCQEAL